MATPQRPYDTTTDTMTEFMGVDAVPVRGNVEGSFESITAPEPLTGEMIGTSQVGYLFDGRLNDSFKVLNRLFDQGVKVTRLAREFVSTRRNISGGCVCGCCWIRGSTYSDCPRLWRYLLRA